MPLLDSPLNDLRSAPAQASPAGAARSSHENVYRTIWRWHLYAGLLVAPVLIWGAVTGALYVFVDEIEGWQFHDALVVEPAGERQPLDRLLEVATEQMREDRIGSIGVQPDPRRTVEFYGGSRSGGFRSIYVDPYRAIFTGTKPQGEGFFPVVRTLHRSLYLGTFGRTVMELTCSWSVILLLTGAYLWWPRKGGRQHRRGDGVWRPRIRGGLRILLRDLHAVIGMYLMPISLVVVLTGMFFTQVWGTAYRSGLARSGGLPTAITNPPRSAASPETPRLPLERVLTIARAHVPADTPLAIDLPRKPEDFYGVSAGRFDDPSQRLRFSVDPHTGDVRARTDWSNSSLMLKVSTFAYPLHVGSIFGWPTKILALLACLVLILSTVTGVWMWWRKKSDGIPPLPRRAPSQRVRWTCLAAMGVMGLFLPMAGLSFLVAALVDWGWRTIRFKTAAS